MEIIKLNINDITPYERTQRFILKHKLNKSRNLFKNSV